MKKLINGVDNVVDEMLRGMAAAHPESRHGSSASRVC